MRMRPLLLAAGLAALAGCGGGGDGGGSAAPEDSFGPTFAAAFRADSNAEPIDPQPGDAGALQPNSDPIEI